MPRALSTTARGYGRAHQAERKRWAVLVDRNGVICWRCKLPIAPGTPFDLGHDDHDRTKHKGPEHRACNRAAGARKGNRSRGRKRGATWRPRLTRVSRLRW